MLPSLAYLHWSGTSLIQSNDAVAGSDLVLLEVFGGVFIVWTIALVWTKFIKKYEPPVPSQEERMVEVFGLVSPEMVCPHCQKRGLVRKKPVRLKKGVSGAKATAAIMTAGFSMLATGLSRKEDLTQAHCGNCDSTWVF